MSSPETLAAQLVSDLRTAHPGVVEEWERQRTDAVASGESPDGWPTFDNTDGALWWLDSEVRIAQGFETGDDTGTETAIISFCLDAIDKILAAREGVR